MSILGDTVAADMPSPGGEAANQKNHSSGVRAPFTFSLYFFTSAVIIKYYLTGALEPY